MTRSSRPIRARGRWGSVIAAFFVFFAHAVDAKAQDDAVNKDAAAISDMKRLAWICGTWTMETGGTVTEEHWRPLQGTTILGTSHSFDESRTHFFEHLRITESRGQIAYIANPGDAGSTAFLLAEIGDDLVVFENARHDYPQRIRYEKTAEGISATISLMDGSRATRFDFRRKEEVPHQASEWGTRNGGQSDGFREPSYIATTGFRTRRSVLPTYDGPPSPSMARA